MPFTGPLVLFSQKGQWKITHKILSFETSKIISAPQSKDQTTCKAKLASCLQTM